MAVGVSALVDSVVVALCVEAVVVVGGLGDAVTSVVSVATAVSIFCGSTVEAVSVLEVVPQDEAKSNTTTRTTFEAPRKLAITNEPTDRDRAHS